MSQKIPIYIPTFINSATYEPARVLPRLYFYNGQLDCETWYIADSNNAANAQTNFPYFDHYNVVSGQFPTTDSLSLLFNNEAAVYGEVPTNSLYANYWSKYVAFLYNPYTRVVNCSAIIPLADYIKMELNDIVNFRGNYYHLRAINDYSLKDGTCNLQLLGPIIGDTFNTNQFTPTGSITTTISPSGSTTTTSTTTLSPNCVCYTVVVTSNGGGESFSAGISYLPCDGGTNMGRNFLNPGTYYQCARVIGGVPQIEFTFGTGTISPNGSCNTGTCPPTPTTTTTAGPTTTTTTFGPATKVVAHNCQDYYDFGTFCVQTSTTPAIGDVYKDSYGTCYTISSIPSDQTLPCIGNLYFVGGVGACSSSACVTTTTTEAPFCHTWTVQNSTGAGYYFKYYYCGQTEPTYLEVPASSTATVCVQNDKIYNSFVAPLTFTDLGTTCIGTTTTTTTIPPQVLFTAANCQNIYDNNTYSANSASYNVGDVFQDDYGTCYYILNFSGEAAVARLTFIGAAGACSSSACVTTTTTVAPFCNTWLVENPFGAGAYYKVKYCGDNFFSYPEALPYSSQSVCVQNNEIYDAFGGVYLTNLSQSCQTTTTTTLAPGCSTFVITNNGDAFSYSGEYVYCGASVSSSYSVGTNSTIRLCVQDGKIDLPSGNNYVVQISGSCNATTTTTTTIAPGCYSYNIRNNSTDSTFIGSYVECGTNYTASYSIPSQTTASLCVLDQKIILPSGTNYTSSFTGPGTCVGTTTTTTAAPTTTTLAPGCFTYNVVNTGAGSAYFDYKYCSGSYVHQELAGGNASMSVCVDNHMISSSYAPMVITYTGASCVPTTTTTSTTSTTTTTTLPPGCFIYNVVNNGVGTGFVNYVYCGSGSVYQQFSLPGGGSGSICVDNYQINDGGNLNMVATLTTGSCIATTTTTAGPTTTTTSTTSTTTTTTSTTTTTTAAPTTTTTTTLASQKYYVETCDGPGTLVGVIEITNAPLLTTKTIRVNTPVFGYSCFQVYSTSTATPLLGTRSVTNIYTDCVDCTD
jgi:hypothetical protein